MSKVIFTVNIQVTTLEYAEFRRNMTSAFVAREHVCFSCCIVRRVLHDSRPPKRYFDTI